MGPWVDEGKGVHLFLQVHESIGLEIDGFQIFLVFPGSNGNLVAEVLLDWFGLRLGHRLVAPVWWHQCGG